MTALLETPGRLPVETEPKQLNERILQVRIDLSRERLRQIRGLVREMRSGHRGTPVRQGGLSEEKMHLDLSWPLHSCDPHQSTGVGSVGSTRRPRPSSMRGASPHGLIGPRPGWNG